MKLRHHIVVSRRNPWNSATVDVELVEGGWTIVGGWGLSEDEYGPDAVNLIIERELEVGETCPQCGTVQRREVTHHKMDCSAG